MEGSMKKTVIQNSVIILTTLLLVFPCDALTRALAVRLTFYSYLPLLYMRFVVVFFSLLDFSNKKVNGCMLAFFVLILFVGFSTSVFPFGSTIFLYVLMTGVLLPHLFKK